MYAMCKQRRARLQEVIDTFNSKGANAIFPDHPGALKSVIRGQGAFIFDCQPKVVHTTSMGNNTCLHQPVLQPIDHGKVKLRYVELTRMELTGSCNPVKCSSKLPVMYKNSNGVALCQYPDKLAACQAGQMLSPSVLQPPVFKTLTNSESHQ